MTLQIISVDPALVEVEMGVNIDLPAVAVVGVDGGEVIGSGGLAWGGGRAWIWFKMRRSRPQYAVPIVRATKRMLRKAVQLGETEVFTPRDASEAMSRKLLMTLGFEHYADEPTASGEMVEVWRWRN